MMADFTISLVFFQLQNITFRDDYIDRISSYLLNSRKPNVLIHGTVAAGLGRQLTENGKDIANNGHQIASVVLRGVYLRPNSIYRRLLSLAHLSISPGKISLSTKCETIFF